MIDISQITKFIKLPPSVIYIILIISGTLLFTDNEFLKMLALLKFKTEYNLYIGIVFLFSFGISIVHLGNIVYVFFKSYFKDKKYRIKIATIIDNLDESEKSILREFLVQQKNSIVVSMEDPSVMNLVHQGIIKQIGNTATQSNISGITFDAKLSDLAKEFITDEKIINKNGDNPRPKWIEKINLQKKYENKIVELGKYLNI